MQALDNYYVIFKNNTSNEIYYIHVHCHTDASIIITANTNIKN